jgi:hypothetical protein
MAAPQANLLKLQHFNSNNLRLELPAANLTLQLFRPVLQPEEP